MEAFPYLSVLISIIIGLGMAHILAATVHAIRERSRTKIYLPSILWAAGAFLILALIWWADFQLVRHETWTFASFIVSLCVPAALYVACGLILPASHEGMGEGMRTAYFENRVWFLSSIAVAIALTYLQTYLLDGHISLDVDSGLKMVLLASTLVPIFMPSSRVQHIAAFWNLALVLLFIAVLFSNLRY